MLKRTNHDFLLIVFTSVIEYMMSSGLSYKLKSFVSWSCTNDGHAMVPCKHDCRQANLEKSLIRSHKAWSCHLKTLGALWVHRIQWQFRLVAINSIWLNSEVLSIWWKNQKWNTTNVHILTNFPYVQCEWTTFNKRLQIPPILELTIGYWTYVASQIWHF